MKKLVLFTALFAGMGLGFSKTVEPLPMKKPIQISINFFEQKKELTFAEKANVLLIRHNCTCGSGGSTDANEPQTCWDYCDADRCKKFPAQCKSS